MEIFLGRQPIFNIHEQVVAYELLYRNKEKNSFPNVNPDKATIDVLVNTLMNIGIEEVTNGKPSFVNFTENLLFSSFVEYLDPLEIVIEVLEDVLITEELVQRLQYLQTKGFTIALDDFILKEENDIYNELFQYVDYIKVDFLNTSVKERMTIETKVKDLFPHIKLLAEKVETRKQFEIAVQSGYSLFQGYFFQQPEIIKGTDIPANTIQYFQVLVLLREDVPNIDTIAETIERDISLSYKLLQLINKSKLRTKSKIRSIKQALLMLGLTDLRKWIYLLAIRDIPNHDKLDIYTELMQRSLLRAKVCDILAMRNNLHNHSEYFLIGLFSLIDTILCRPMNVILQRMPLSEELIVTLSGGKTELTPYLQFSIAICKADMRKAIEIGEIWGLTEDDVLEIIQEAKEWVKEAYTDYKIK